MHGHAFIDQVINAFLRSAVFRMMGALTKGQSSIAVVVICVVVLSLVWAYQRFVRQERKGT